MAPTPVASPRIVMVRVDGMRIVCPVLVEPVVAGTGVCMQVAE